MMSFREYESKGICANTDSGEETGCAGEKNVDLKISAQEKQCAINVKLSMNTRLILLLRNHV